MTMVTSTGNEPVTDFQARQASTNVINWPLSSSAPRATMIFRPSAWSAIGRLERRTMPEIERIDRLHIVVTVEQHMRPPAIFGPAVDLGDDRRMTGRRPDLGGETERRDIPGQMIGGRLAVAGKGRIGRDRLDPQQGKQPLEAVVEIGIDAIEDRLKLRRAGHCNLSLGEFG